MSPAAPEDKERKDMLDWEMIVDGYNLTHGTKYTTKGMMEYLYARIGNTKKIADYLGVSTDAVTRKMDLLNVAREHRTAWPGSYADKLRGIPDVRMAEMSAKEIAKKIGCNPKYIYTYLGRDNRRWNRTYKGAL